jgi:hypothetical protein
MAMQYQNYASLGVNLNRQKYGPLDISNVFTSAADLKYYLTKGAYTEGVSEYWYKNAIDKTVPYPYEGQVLATVIDGVVNVYALALDADGNFVTQEIGAKVEADGTSIKLNADGKLELVGLPADTDGKTYIPSYINGVLTWAEPDTSAAEGQQAAISALEVRAKALEVTLNGVEAAEGVEAVKGLVEKVADEVAAREAADAALDGKITEAIQAAKDYTDENKYNDAALANRVKTIEDDYLKAADKYDDTGIRSFITALDEAIGDTSKGIVKDVADNKQAILDEKTRAEAAEKALSDKINAIDFVDTNELAIAITEAKGYTDAEIVKVNAAIAALNHFKTEIVENTDAVKETGVLYLIKDDTVAGVDKYNEYIVVDGKAVLIGDTTTDLSNYYNKTEIDGKIVAINAAISDADSKLAKKIETGSIVHSTDIIAEGITVEGTNLNIVVDAFTKEETLTKIDEKIAYFTGGESAAAVLSALNTYKETNDDKVTALANKDAAMDSAITALQATVSGDGARISAVEGEITALKTELAEQIVEHTQKLSEIDAVITALKASTEVTIADDGTLEIGEVSTDKLVQGSMTLVLNGGNANTSTK